MNKINLNSYLSIVLSLVFLGLTVLEANTVYVLYNFQVSEVGLAQNIGENVSFQMEFNQNIGTAAVYLILTAYFAAMSLLKFPMIEISKDSKSKKSDSDESEEK